MKHVDPYLKKYVEKLYTLNLYGRWFFVILSWIILGSWGIWGLREYIPILQDYFTWTALRYAFHYNPVSTLCLSFCVGVTAAVLVWQSRNILAGGLALEEKRRLEKQAQAILKKGPSHPLWKWVCQPSKKD